MSLRHIKHIVLVLSGKGGVGKSSVTTQLALSLALHGHNVGVLDLDLTGPSIPRFMGIEGEKVKQAPGGWLPVLVHDKKDRRKPETQEEAEEEENVEGENKTHPRRPEAQQQTPGQTPKESLRSRGAENSLPIGKLSAMSLGFLLASRNDAVVWRGPKKTAMVRQFLSDVQWGPLDYLLIDTPPGTSDEHISLVETLLKDATSAQLAGAVIVTTPQAISVSDVKKEINFCRKVGVEILGVVENMAGFVCPNCSECTNVFSKGGGAAMAHEFKVPFLGSVPIDPMFIRLIEEGRWPSYPVGTEIQGRNMITLNGKADEENGNVDGLLVDKYTACSLCPIFDAITSELTTRIEWKENSSSL